MPLRSKKKKKKQIPVQTHKCGDVGLHSVLGPTNGADIGYLKVCWPELGFGRRCGGSLFQLEIVLGSTATGLIESLACSRK